MEIIKYDESKESMFVTFSTNLVWEYVGVKKNEFEEISAALKQNLPVQHYLRNSKYVGILKEVDLDAK